MNGDPRFSTWGSSRLALAVTLGFGLAAGQGCLAQTLDPSVSGAFACDADEDCPDGQACLQGRCYTGPLPSVSVFSPEEDSLLPYDDGLGEVRTVLVTIAGTDLELVDPAADPDAAVGLGQVEVEVDGVNVATVMAGDLSGTVAIEVPVTNRPGVHRIEVQAVLSDGTLYDNPEATGRRVFWFDDGKPHVAIKRPWPGTPVDVEAASTEVEVSAIGIMLDAPGTSVTPGIGHTHIHYDETFPACANDNLCDQSYQGIVPIMSGMLSADVLLPSSGAGSAKLTAVLREANHTAFNDENGNIVYDEVAVLRTDLP